MNADSKIYNPEFIKPFCEEHRSEHRAEYICKSCLDDYRKLQQQLEKAEKVLEKILKKGERNNLCLSSLCKELIKEVRNCHIYCDGICEGEYRQSLIAEKYFQEKEEQ